MVKSLDMNFTVVFRRLFFLLLFSVNCYKNMFGSCKASFKNNPVYVGIGFNSNGSLTTTIPNGPAYDSYRVTVLVKVIDDFGGITQYPIEPSIQVLLNMSLTSSLIDQMKNINSNSGLMQQMFSGNPQVIMQTVNGMCSMLNSMASLDQPDTTFNFGPGSIGSNVNFDSLSELRSSQAETNSNVVSEANSNLAYLFFCVKCDC